VPVLTCTRNIPVVEIGNSCESRLANIRAGSGYIMTFIFGIKWHKMKALPGLFAFLCIITWHAAGQNKVLVTGDIGLYGDFYKMNTSGDSSLQPRRPATLTRLLFNPTFTYGDFSLPFTIMLSSQQTNVVTPASNSNNIWDFIENPLNNVGLAPKYKWVQLLLGSQTPHYSDLTLGNIPVFGAGFNLAPGKFRLSFFKGVSQRAIETDSSRNIPGSYKRDFYSAKIGVGSEEASHIYLIAAKIQDDTMSIKSRPVDIMPQSGIVSSLDYRVNIGKKFYVKGEVAGSAFTRDTRAKEWDILAELPKVIFITQESSRLNYASNLTIGKTGKIFGIKLAGSYIGDGFVPLGYPFMQTDKLEVTLEPMLNLFKNRLNLSGSIGQRINNLSGARGSTATQTIGFANINTQLSERLSISADFSNYGFRNSVLNDTFRVEMVTMAFGVSPTYTITGTKTIHSFSLSYNQDQFRDYNIISGALNNNDSRTALASYTLAFTTNPLTLSLMLSNFENTTGLGKLTMNSINVGCTYGFFKNKLIASLAEGATQSGLSGYTPALQIITIAGLRYKMLKNLYFNITGSINDFNYGAERPGVSFRENLIRSSIIYKF